jgi:hypothetical protein
MSNPDNFFHCRSKQISRASADIKICKTLRETYADCSRRANCALSPCIFGPQERSSHFEPELLLINH